MELYAVEAFFFVGHNGERTALGAGDGHEVGRNRRHFIAVAHPHVQQRFAVCGQGIFNTANQRAVGQYFDLRVTKFTLIRTFYMTAKLHRHGLHPVADANTGTPASKTYCGARGLFSSVVLSGRRKE